MATNAAWAGVVAVAALLGLSLGISWRPLAEKAWPGVQPAWLRG